MSSTQNRGTPSPIQTQHRTQLAHTHRTARTRGPAAAQAAHEQNRTCLATQTKDKDDISRILLEKMGEIDKQLQKLPDFEENIKNLLIPVLNHYLNLNQLDAK